MGQCVEGREGLCPATHLAYHVARGVLRAREGRQLPPHGLVGPGLRSPVPSIQSKPAAWTKLQPSEGPVTLARGPWVPQPHSQEHSSLHMLQGPVPLTWTPHVTCEVRTILSHWMNEETEVRKRQAHCASHGGCSKAGSPPPAGLHLPSQDSGPPTGPPPPPAPAQGLSLSAPHPSLSRACFSSGFPGAKAVRSPLSVPPRWTVFGLELYFWNE